MRDLPGLGRSLCGLAIAPFRWLAVLLSLRGFAAVLAIAVLLLMAYVLSIPLLNSCGRDARRSEGEQMMGSMKGQLRVAYNRTKSVEGAREELKRLGSERLGQYYHIEPLLVIVDENTARVHAYPLYAGGSPGYHEFSWEGGAGTFHWDDEMRRE